MGGGGGVCVFTRVCMQRAKGDMLKCFMGACSGILIRVHMQCCIETTYRRSEAVWKACGKDMTHAHQLGRGVGKHDHASMGSKGHKARCIQADTTSYDVQSLWGLRKARLPLILEEPTVSDWHPDVA